MVATTLTCPQPLPLPEEGPSQAPAGTVLHPLNPPPTSAPTSSSPAHPGRLGSRASGGVQGESSLGPWA